MTSDRSTSPGKRTRIQFTHSQKQEIRDFYHSHGNCNAKTLRTWFVSKHGILLKPSTISTILKSSDKSGVSPNNKIRARLPKYPALESRLKEWVQDADKRDSEHRLTNEMIKAKAIEIWAELQLDNDSSSSSSSPSPSSSFSSPSPGQQKCPSFSEGWIEKFKKRINMPRSKPLSVSSAGAETINSSSLKSNDAADSSFPSLILPPPSAITESISANGTFHSDSTDDDKPTLNSTAVPLNSLLNAFPSSGSVKSSAFYASPPSIRISNIHSILNPN